ncbi:hypothetical protein P3X46_018881 [Hevea brasiliensis]|uniref:Tubby C-terminal domain-containing protein n=1 Tax=Hevea brasiliensis TaxID=3981 RepID=A0ABQ9LTG2_HEVBR|nr:hypothetical protein P3X46_018881 [Hevea brasiliensis]
MSCSSLSCVKAENPVRILSAKPEWHKAQARFMRSLCMEKEGKKRATCAYSASPFGYYRMSMEGDHKVFSFGSDITDTGSPDSYVFRQRYLRSYQLTREEENSKTKDKKKKKRGESTGKSKSNKLATTSRSCVETCFKFLFCFVAKVDVHHQAFQKQAASASNFSTIPSRLFL